jgi:ribonuclease P protein component
MITPVKNKKKIEIIFDNGKVIRKGPLLIKFHDFNDDENEYGISVPKRYFKSAVIRNKIKRQFREILKKQSKLRKGVCFFIIYNSSKSSPFGKLKGLTESLIENLIVKTS